MDYKKKELVNLIEELDDLKIVIFLIDIIHSFEEKRGT